MNSQTLRSGIAASTCVVCGIAVSVAVGVVPRAAGEDNIRLVSATTASASDASLAQLLYPTQPSHVQAPYRAAPVSHAVTKSAPAVHTAVAHATAAHVVSAVATTATKTPSTDHKKKTHKAAHKKHHKKAHHKKAHHKKPSAPTLAARTTPTQTAVSNAINGLKKYVHTPFSINSSEVAQFGDAVCGAFDDNASFAHVKAEIMQKVKQIPFTTVADGAADYVVKTAVKLYCPAYASRTS